MKKLIKILFLLFIFSELIYLFGYVVYKNVTQEAFYNKENKAWSHRGVASDDNENSIESFDNAIKKGYQGVEIDVWYKDSSFYVSHEENFSDTLPRLLDFFITFSDQKIWIDLKNLNDKNTNEIIRSLKKLSIINKDFIIESKNAISLRKFSSNNIKSCLWVNPTKTSFYLLPFSKNGLRELFNMFIISCSNYNAISMPLSVYDNETIQKRYNHLNIHTWTTLSIYDERYSFFAKKKEIKVILNDQEKLKNSSY